MNKHKSTPFPLMDLDGNLTCDSSLYRNALLYEKADASDVLPADTLEQEQREISCILYYGYPNNATFDTVTSLQDKYNLTSLQYRIITQAAIWRSMWDYGTYEITEATVNGQLDEKILYLIELKRMDVTTATGMGYGAHFNDPDTFISDSNPYCTPDMYKAYTELRERILEQDMSDEIEVQYYKNQNSNSYLYVQDLVTSNLSVGPEEDTPSLWSVQLEFQKNLDNIPSSVSGFVFALYDDDNTLISVTQNVGENICFPMLFTNSGEKTYTVKESGSVFLDFSATMPTNEEEYRLSSLTLCEGDIKKDAADYTGFNPVALSEGHIESQMYDANGSVQFKPIEIQEVGEYVYTLTNCVEHGSRMDFNSVSYTISVTKDEHDVLSAKITNTEEYKVSETDSEFVTSTGELGMDPNVNVISSPSGYSLDPSVYTVTVCVDESKKNPKVTYKQNDEIVLSPVFSNETTTFATLKASKKLTGKELKEGEFSFTLQAGEGTPLPEIVTVSNDAEGNVEFGKITYRTEGTYVYTIVEEDTKEYGVEYDSTKHTAIVSVTKSEDGILSSEVSYDRGSDEIPVFTNCYREEPLPTVINLIGTKELIGKTMQENRFRFEVWEGEKIVATGTNNEDGTIVFTTIPYTTVGEHYYVIKEVKGEEKGIAYDTSEKNVTVEVIDNENGTLQAIVTEDSDPIAFTNFYIPETGVNTNVCGFGMTCILTALAVGYLLIRKYI